MNSNWKLDYCSDTVIQFIFDGKDEMTITASKSESNLIPPIINRDSWNWSGSHCKYGEQWPMSKRELQNYANDISRNFQAVL